MENLLLTPQKCKLYNKMKHLKKWISDQKKIGKIYIKKKKLDNLKNWVVSEKEI